MGDNDKFCGAWCSNAWCRWASLPRDSLSPSSLFRNRPWRNAPKGCVAQAFQDMTKTRVCFQRVCQIAFLPALICVVSLLVLFIPVIGGIAAAIGFLALHCERVRFRLWYRVGP